MIILRYFSKMNLYYWAPFLSNVATVQAVLNSATGVKKYSKKNTTTYNQCSG